MPKLLKIEGVEIPSPTKYDIKLIDVDSPATGRGDSGYMTRDRVRSDVASIEVAWMLLSTEELNIIQAATHKPQFTVEYFIGGNPDNNTRTADMYVGDRDISMVYADESGQDAKWNLRFTLIEL